MSNDQNNEANEEVTYLTSDDNLRITDTEPKEVEQGNGEARQAWGGKVEFLFSCLSYAVGLGNVWRFPYMCYKNGGGAFIIPFTLMLICVGIPLMFMETCFGQYSATGPISVWKASPLFTGIGWSMCCITFAGSIYYNMIIAWTLFYFWQSIISFGSRLPWTTCKAEWNTGNCMHIRTKIEQRKCSKTGGFFSFHLNRTCLMPNNRSWIMEDPESDVIAMQPSNQLNNTFGVSMDENFMHALSLNGTNSTVLRQYLGATAKPSSSSDEYFHNFVLSISNGFHEIGMPKWELSICLLIAWIIVVLCLLRGIKTAGKAVYFTSLFPYLVLTILLIRGLTLEGAAAGIKYFFIPNWSMLLRPGVWGDAAIQVFFSLSSGWGGIIALSSYNKFHNNALLDSFIVSIGDGLTSIYAGMAVFCVLGYMSHTMSIPIDAVAQEGAGLVFVLYPEIVTSLPLSPLWATLFFAMMLTLGFGTMISNVNTLKTAVCDYWPDVLQVGQRPLMVLCGISTVAFLLGLSCTTRGGMFVLQLLDNYCCTYSVLVVGFLELIVITWVYGADTFCENVDEIMKKPLNRAWKYIWKFFSPIVILAVALFTFATVKPSKYGSYTYPIGADLFGAFISVLILVPIPAVAIFKAWRLDLPGLTFWQRARELLKPDRDWGREMGRKPNGYYSAVNSAKAYESQQPLTTTGSFVQSNTTVATSAHLVSQNQL